MLINRKDQIMLTAQQLFRSKGFSATSMRDLATVVGIEASSIYSHIKSKDEILEFICFSMADQFFQKMEAASFDEMSPINKLSAAIKGHVDVITENTDASGVFFNEWKHLKDQSLIKFKELRDQYEQKFVTIIEEGISRQVFQNIDSKFTVLSILSSLNWVYEWYNPRGEMNPTQIADNLTKILLKGIENKEHGNH